jgi:hypothetical protein
MNAPLHVVQRADGIWQIEREDGVVPLSLHETRDGALDAALARARRERTSLALHRTARRPVSWVDRLARAMLSRELDGSSRQAG